MADMLIALRAEKQNIAGLYCGSSVDNSL